MGIFDCLLHLVRNFKDFTYPGPGVPHHHGLLGGHVRRRHHDSVVVLGVILRVLLDHLSHCLLMVLQLLLLVAIVCLVVDELFLFIVLSDALIRQFSDLLLTLNHVLNVLRGEEVA